MGVAPLVHIGKAGDNLADNGAGGVFGHALVGQLFNMMVQTGTHTLFHYQMYVRPLINHLKQRHNVGVIQV